MIDSADEITLPGAAAATAGRDGKRSNGHLPVVVVGGGQAGLCVSYELKRRGFGHVVLEQHKIGHAWRTDRWDSFCLVTPNWQCQLPGYPYQGPDPDGFMLKDEIVAYVEGFARMVDPPIHEDVTVTRVSRQPDGCYLVESTMGDWTADAVVMAISGYHVPAVPRVGERVPRDLVQIHSKDYRNPEQLPAGAVLVVGTGQSGCHIGEDVPRAARLVHLAVGDAPRSPRLYRGKDAIKWLDEMGYYKLTVDDHPLGTAVRRKANHYFSGRGGGREIDLRKFAAEGMRLYGMLDAIDGDTVTFRPDLAANLDSADKVYLRIRAMIDDHIAKTGIAAPAAEPYEAPWRVEAEPRSLDLKAEEVTSVVWSTGFRADFSLVDVPVFNGTGTPCHHRGVTAVPGLYILGLGWLWTWGSGRFSGIAEDAAHVVDDFSRRWSADLSRQRRQRGS